MSVKKPRPASTIGRKRRAAGWTLLTLGVIVAGVWGASGWWVFAKNWKYQKVVILGGVVDWGLGGPYPEQWELRSIPKSWGPTRVYWWGWDSKAGFSNWGVYQHIRYPQGRGVSLRVLLWPYPLLLLATSAPILRSGIVARRRVMKGMCGTCGYSLAGLGDGAACPECGKASMQKIIS